MMGRPISCSAIFAATLLTVLIGCGSDDSDKVIPTPSGGPNATIGSTTQKTRSAEATTTSRAPSMSQSETTNAASTTKNEWPALFPDDFPFPTNLNIEETRDERLTGLVGGSTTTGIDEFIEFYDSRLPGLGWQFDETTSSGGAHVYSRGALSTAIVAASVPGKPDTTFQITISSSD